MPEIPLAYYYFGYIPNHIANGVALAVFSLLFIMLVYRVFFSATSPKFLLLLPFTAATEIAGFALRYVCSTNPAADLFTAMSILLLLSANILVLVNYKAVGDVIRLSGVETRYFIINSQFTKTFYKVNIVSSILTGVGGGMQADNRVLGSALIIAGVTIQLICFCVFVACMRYVHTCPDYQYRANDQQDPKSKLMRVMYITMAFIIIRSVYRLINFIVILIDPTDVHEWTFYVFDALLIALCFLIHCIWHTGNYLPSSQEELNQKAGYEFDMENGSPPSTKDYQRGYNNV